MPVVAEPRAAYGVAFIAALAIAVSTVVILANRDKIETALGQAPARAAAPSCRLAPGQVAHIVVHLDHGELVARCRVVAGRS